MWAVDGYGAGSTAGRPAVRCTPIARMCLAPRWIAGDNGECMRTPPSLYQSPSMDVAGKKIGMAAEAMTWSRVMCACSEVRVRRTQGRISGFAS